MSDLGRRRFNTFCILLSAVIMSLIWVSPTVAEETQTFTLTSGQETVSNSSQGKSVYGNTWSTQDGPNGTTRLTYGERYRRNPDGSYGARSSSQGDIGGRLLEQALSAGGGYFSSWAEGWLGGYGKARINIRVNDDGDVVGSGDFLLPIYDSEYSTLFTQLGLRTMSGDRVIGNFGLGQRFFPTDNLALGYNLFIDQDFSRNHTRGGAGVEAWYDWVRLSANYYAPLSNWKDSKDFNSNFVEERPAEGFDARLTGYLPFYRNLALTGAFEKWDGDHVGAFGSDDFLAKNPTVWSYGLEWTPVPVISTSINQRHSGGHKETQFGLTFNYNFDMSWEDQLTPATVVEMRTVGGSRHDFVNRQNEVILKYRSKDIRYSIVPNVTSLALSDATFFPNHSGTVIFSIAPHNNVQVAKVVFSPISVPHTGNMTWSFDPASNALQITASVDVSVNTNITATVYFVDMNGKDIGQVTLTIYIDNDV